MDKILEVHQMISNRFQDNKAVQNHFYKPENKDAYVAYYNSVFLIQDTGEAVYTHMKRDFSNDPMQAYIELWGVMQAIIIQQDAICELYSAVTGEKPDTETFAAWEK